MSSFQKGNIELLFWGCTENFVDTKVFQNSHLPKLTNKNTYAAYFI